MLGRRLVRLTSEQIAPHSLVERNEFKSRRLMVFSFPRTIKMSDPRRGAIWQDGTPLDGTQRGLWGVPEDRNCRREAVYEVASGLRNCGQVDLLWPTPVRWIAYHGTDTDTGMPSFFTLSFSGG